MQSKASALIPLCLTLLVAYLVFFNRAGHYTPSPGNELPPPSLPAQPIDSITSTPPVDGALAPTPPTPNQVPGVSTNQAASITNQQPDSLPAQSITELPPKKEKDWPIQVFRNGSNKDKKIAITFDDGPHSKYTPRVLDILRERNIKATFFVLGARIKQSPWVLQQIVAEGHEVGNHTYDHRLLTAQSNEVIEREIFDTQKEIRNAIGYETRLFRPPYGAYRQSTREILFNHHFIVILWSIDPKDWKYRDSDRLIEYVNKHVENGSIILCHDIHGETIKALPSLLDDLLEKGFEFKTVNELCGIPPMQPVSSSPGKTEKQTSAQR